MDDLKSTEAELIQAEKTALVIIDLQNGIADRQGAPYTVCAGCSECQQINEGVYCAGSLCNTGKSFIGRWKRYAKTKAGF